MYTSVIRPLLFLGEAERIHGMLVSFLCFYRYLFPFRKWVRRYYRVNGREFSWNGLTFKNRIGLSAGFDKGGECFDELADFGFGFIELGTLTPQFQAGNPRPRIFRLPADLVLISRTGFNNPGMDGLAWNICRRGTEHRYLLGININRDPQSEGEAAVNDFLRLFIRFYEEADYFTLNWGALPAEWFEKVLKALDAYRRSQAVHRFMRVKLPADIQETELEKVMGLAKEYGVDGFIATGPTQDRSGIVHYTEAELEKIGPGGVSGKGIGEKSFRVVRWLAVRGNDSLLIIGAGGLSTPEDVERMLRSGAHLVQIYSSFIYNGPGVVKRMAKVTLN